MSSPPASLLQMKGFPTYLFKQPVDDQFHCGLCKLVLRWPMQKECGCRFCCGCIQNYISGKDGQIPCPSPECKESFDSNKIFSDNYARKQLEKAMVFCQNKSNGCPDEMTLIDLDVHLENCKYQGCTAMLLRGQIAEHLHSECQFRQATCEYCAEEFCVMDLKEHQEKCKADLVECPNKCSPLGIHQAKKIIAQQSDQLDKFDTMFKQLQERQDQMDERLKRLERGAGAGAGGGDEDGPGSGNAGVVSNARMASIENQMGMHAVRLAEHELRFQVMETANYEGVLIWKIKDFARRKRDADSGKTLSLYSQPFYTSRYGYKMCARVYLNGDGTGKGTHVSLFFVVMRGEYDAFLPWPFQQKVTLMLLDQETGRHHLSDSFRPDPKSSSFQRPTTEMNIASECPLFVNQIVLKDTTYVKDDVIFIKIIVDTYVDFDDLNIVF